MNKLSFSLALASFVVPALLSARVILPAHFTSNMVLQQQSSLLIKGQARPNATVDLQTSWSRTPVSATADGQGRFAGPKTERVTTRPAYGPVQPAPAEEAQENLLVGRNPIREALKSGRESRRSSCRRWTAPSWTRWSPAIRE